MLRESICLAVFGTRSAPPKKNARTFLRLGGEAALQSPSDKDPKAREEVGNSRVREPSALIGVGMRQFRCGINGIYAAVRQIN